MARCLSRAEPLVDDHFMARPMQEAAIDVVTSGAWRAQLRLITATLRERAAVLATALTRHLPASRFSMPRGGISLWLELPQRQPEAELAERAAARGVAVYPGHIFKIGESDRAHLRLGYAAIQSHDIDRAVAILAGVVIDQQPPYSG